MEYVRYIHRKHFDPHPSQNRFKSLAFRDTDGSGVSVVQCVCVDGSGRTVCAHAKHFYSPTITDDPPVFWQFDDAILPQGSVLEQKTSKSGDVCHHNIKNAKDKDLRQLFKNQDFRTFYICEGDGTFRHLRREDLP